MTARLRELMEEATPGPICESALVPLYAVQDYGYNEAVAAFAEFDDEGELTMQFQGDKAKANSRCTLSSSTTPPPSSACLRRWRDMRLATTR